MHGESLKVGGAFQTMSEVVHSVRQRHLQHRELDTNYTASICDWLYTCSYSFSFFKALRVNMFGFRCALLLWLCVLLLQVNKKLLYHESDL